MYCLTIQFPCLMMNFDQVKLKLSSFSAHSERKSDVINLDSAVCFIGGRSEGQGAHSPHNVWHNWSYECQTCGESTTEWRLTFNPWGYTNIAPFLLIISLKLFDKSQAIWQVSSYLTRLKLFDTSQVIWHVSSYLTRLKLFETSQVIWQVSS